MKWVRQKKKGQTSRNTLVSDGSALTPEHERAIWRTGRKQLVARCNRNQHRACGSGCGAEVRWGVGQVGGHSACTSTPCESKLGKEGVRPTRSSTQSHIQQRRPHSMRYARFDSTRMPTQWVRNAQVYSGFDKPTQTVWIGTRRVEVKSRDSNWHTSSRASRARREWRACCRFQWRGA